VKDDLDGLPAFFSSQPEHLQLVAHLLLQSKAVVLPTETVYGLAANALDPIAVQLIFQIKNRPLIDPLIVHVADVEQAQDLAYFSPIAWSLARAFWPGPLTLVLPKKPCVPDVVTAGLPAVGVRCPQHPLFQSILKLTQLPLAAPSANPFGYVSPTRPEHVRATLGQKAPYILDGGPCQHGIESTIISLTQPDKPTLLRPGPFSQQDIESVLNQSITVATQPSAPHQPQAAPGLLSSHYSPYTPLILFETAPPTNSQYARVFWQRPREPHDNDYWLSETQNVAEASRNCYHLLQVLDQQGYSSIFWEQCPASSDWDGLRNRLIRASHKRSS